MLTQYFSNISDVAMFLYFLIFQTIHLHRNLWSQPARNDYSRPKFTSQLSKAVFLLQLKHCCCLWRNKLWFSRDSQWHNLLFKYELEYMDYHKSSTVKLFGNWNPRFGLRLLQCAKYAFYYFSLYVFSFIFLVSHLFLELIGASNF